MRSRPGRRPRVRRDLTLSCLDSAVQSGVSEKRSAPDRPGSADTAEQAAQRQAFGANVRAERTRAGMTQEQVAAAAGLNRTYVISIEKGRQNLSLQAIWLLANAIGVRPEVLFADHAGDDDSQAQ